MQNYVTFFNYKYLIRGLLLYESLNKNVDNFRLYVIAFDQYTYNYLMNKKFKKITPIKFKDFEDKELLSVKKTRSSTEYFWTCSGSSILYLFKKKKIKDCTYLDADTFFFDYPAKIIKSINKESCIITKHNYSKEYNQSNTNGIFCVQFMYFKNNAIAKKILTRWRNQCLEWCYNRVEDGKFGDQKYLDEWPDIYKKHVLICEEKGAGLAPWNIQDYELFRKNKKFYAKNIISKKKFDIYFYHFHELKILNSNLSYIGNYKIPKIAYDLIYSPYIKRYYDLLSGMKKKNKNLFFDNFGRESFMINTFKFLKNIKNFKFFL